MMNLKKIVHNVKEYVPMKLDFLEYTVPPSVPSLDFSLGLGEIIVSLMPKRVDA